MLDKKPTKRDGGGTRVNKAELFKPVSQLEREKQAAEFEQREAEGRSTKSKKKSKKKKSKKKGKKSRKDNDYDIDDEDESDESSEAEETNDSDKVKKKERDEDDEPAGCCQFCFWNFREGHRCLSFFSFYNEFLPRPTRWLILVMSWYLFMGFTGLFIGGAQIISTKDNRLEQLIIGAITSVFVRFWILLVTALMMHPKENKVHEQLNNKIKANREIRNNNAMYYAGLVILVISISKCHSLLI